MAVSSDGMGQTMGKEALPFDSPELLMILDKIPGVVVGRDIEQFNEGEYQSSLEAYTEENRHLFEKLEALCRENPEHSKEMMAKVCGQLMDAIEADLENPAKPYRFNGRALQFDIYKMVILTYLTPAVFKMELEISKAFAETFHEEWLRRYPKQPYQIVTEQEIAAGFGRKWYQCYVTQAVCSWLGKDDDGYELTAFRHFRDVYLRACPDGEALIKEYYRDAPIITAKIELYGLGNKVYPELWEQYLQPCLKDLEGKQFERCKRRYIHMVRELQQRFLLLEQSGPPV